MVVYIDRILEAKLKKSGRTVKELLEAALSDVALDEDFFYYAPPVPAKRQAILDMIPTAPPGVTIPEIMARCHVSRPTATAALAVCPGIQSAPRPLEKGQTTAPFRGYWKVPLPPTTQAPESKDPSPTTTPPPVEVKSNE